MNNTLCALLLSLISSLSCAFAASPHDDQALVHALNDRYKHTVSQCTDGLPAYYCSGILLRTVTYSAQYKFWTHSPAANDLGSLTFSYLRDDVGTRSLNGTTGFVLTDQHSAIDAGNAQNIRCIYPFMANTQANNRGAAGCGFAATTTPVLADPSSCQTLSTPVLSAAQWLANFAQHGADYVNQCSLSTHVASQFEAALRAHQDSFINNAHSPTEVLVEAWDVTQPGQLPIEAFFFLASAPAQQAQAQQLQQDYQLATGRHVPVLRLNLADSQRNVFSLPGAPPEPVGGEALATALNVRYDDTANACEGGTPAYDCDGVILRIVDYSPAFHAWNPSPGSVTRGSVAFSYLRRDLGITRLAWEGTEAGLIFKALGAARQDQDYPMNLLCSFPSDAGSFYRADNGCGATPAYPQASRYCSAQGITTVAQWVTHYHAVAGHPDGGYSARSEHQCAFAANTQAFALSLEVRQHFQQPVERTRHNEILLRTWPQDIGEQLPVEAFFYHYTGTGDQGLAAAQGIQRDYYEVTGRAVPIMRLNLGAPGDSPFTYLPGDQAIAPLQPGHLQ